MRVLVSSTRGAGHFAPLVPFAQACLRAGHEVLAAGPPDLEETVAAAGLDFWRFDSPPEEELGPVWGRVPTASREEGEQLVIGEIFGRLNTTAALPRLQEACEEWRPDVVLRESAEFASALAAELHGVSHARVATGLSAAEAVLLSEGRALGRRHPPEAGLSPDPDAEVLRRSPYLTHVPRRAGRPGPAGRAAHASLRRPGLGGHSRRAPGLVGRRERAAGVRQLRQRGRRLGDGSRRLSRCGGGDGGPGCPRPADGRPHRRPERLLLGPGQRARRGVGAPGRRPRARGAGGVPRRVGHHAGLAGGRPPAGGGAPVRRPAAQRGARGGGRRGLAVAPEAAAIRAATKQVLAEPRYARDGGGGGRRAGLPPAGRRRRRRAASGWPARPRPCGPNAPAGPARSAALGCAGPARSAPRPAGRACPWPERWRSPPPAG